MNPYQTLLALRLFELALMLWAVWRLIHLPPQPGRSRRLTFGCALVALNLAAIVVAVGWAKVTLW